MTATTGPSISACKEAFAALHENRMVERRMAASPETFAWVDELAAAHHRPPVDYYYAALYAGAGREHAQSRDLDLVLSDGQDVVPLGKPILFTPKAGETELRDIDLHVQDNQLVRWAQRERGVAFSELMNNGIQILGAWALTPDYRFWYADNDLSNLARFALRDTVYVANMRPLELEKI